MSRPAARSEITRVTAFRRVAEAHMLDRDAVARRGLFADPCYERIGARIPAPRVPVDGLAAAASRVSCQSAVAGAAIKAASAASVSLKRIPMSSNIRKSRAGISMASKRVACDPADHVRPTRCGPPRETALPARLPEIRIGLAQNMMTEHQSGVSGDARGPDAPCCKPVHSPDRGAAGCGKRPQPPRAHRP